MNKLLHQSIVVYLAVIVLLRMMAMPLSLLDYSLNQRFIAQNLCENRTKPDLHCGGTCYLNKQLAKSNDSQEPADQKGTFKNLVIDYFEPLPKLCTDVQHQELKMPYRVYSPRISSPFTGVILRPPIA